MKHALKIFSLILLSIFCLSSAHAADPAPEQAVTVIGPGKKVKMHFTMKSNGVILEDTRVKKIPFEFTVGEQPMIPGVMEAIKGLKAGDKKQISLTPEQGFGIANPKAIIEFPKSQFKEKNIQAGMVFNGQTKEGQPLRGTVKEVKKDSVVLDFNHPLAGKSLDMDVEIIEVV